MSHLIGHITYPQETSFAVEYTKLYRENDSSLLEFCLVNNGKKTVNAYRIDLSYTANGEEKKENIQCKNIELFSGTRTEVISHSLPSEVEEGSITITAVIYDDFSHNETTPTFPFASFDTVSRVAEEALSGKTPVARGKITVQPAKESLTSIAKGQSTSPASAAVEAAKKEALVKKSAAPLILALCSLGGFVLTFFLHAIAYFYIADYFVGNFISTGTIGNLYLITSLVSLTLYTACATLALIAILLGKKNPRHRAGVLCIGIGTLLLYLFSQANALGIFLLTSVVLTIVFFILSLVKKNLPLIIVTSCMLLLILTSLSMSLGIGLSCHSGTADKAPTDTIGQVEQGTASSSDWQLQLEFVSNGDGTCYIAGSHWSSGSSVENSPYLDNETGVLTIPDYSPDGDYIIEIRSLDIGDATSMTLPGGVKRIGDYCFDGSHSLKTVTLPWALEEIGYRAFYECTALESILSLDSIKIIQQEAFAHCGNLREVHLGSSLETIEAQAFYNSGLTSISLPESVVEMGERIFAYCYALERAEISCTLRLPYATFADCPVLKTVSLPYGMTEIGEYAFSNSGLTYMELPETVTIIYRSAFENCTDLQRVFVPYAVTEIDEDAFYNCHSLNAVYWGRTEDDLNFVYPAGGNHNLLEAPTQYYGLYNVCFSDNEDGATCTFWAAYSNNRTHFVIPQYAPNGKEVTVIDSASFKNNVQLQSVTIPNTVKTIEYEAFKGCITLNEIIFNGDEDEWLQIEIAPGNEILNDVRIVFDALGWDDLVPLT